MTEPYSKQPRITIFTKLVITILIIILPMYVISLLMNKYAADIVRKELSSSTGERANYAISSIESEIERIVSLQKSFINDPDLNDLSIRSGSLTSYERNKAFNDLSYKVDLLASSSKYVQEVFVLMPNLQKRLSSRTGVDTVEPREFEALRSSGRTQALTSYDRDRLLLTIGYPVFTRSQYILAIELSVATIGRDLGFLKSSNDSAIFLADVTNRRMLYEKSDGVNMNDLVYRELSGQQRVNINGTSYLITQRVSALLGWSLTIAVPDNEALRPVYSLKNWYYLLSVFAVIVAFLASFAIYRLIHSPLKKLIAAFRRVEQGTLDIQIERREPDEFHYLYNQFNKSVKKIKELIQEVYEKTIHSQQAELKQLQSQINPHFFYNSLYILYMMAHEENIDGVKNLSRYLGDYFKFITYNKADLVALELELNHARTYASIQQLRFSNRLTCEFITDGDLSSWEVPRLIIQPMLENAINHGISGLVEGGKVVVQTRCESRVLTVMVEDNGAGMDEQTLSALNIGLENASEGSDIHGIFNVHRRLKLHYGSASGVYLRINEAGGLTVTIHIELAEHLSARRDADEIDLDRR
ncbi:histidine kinase [Paenibacillus sp. MBLB4367]|uniref:sensor histidine kinase n=1 Tax=Paenibacillus sp. MBLB4367 TaxID=3384767 RepID=UPI0039080BD1